MIIVVNGKKQGIQDNFSIYYYFIFLLDEDESYKQIQRNFVFNY